MITIYIGYDSSNYGQELAFEVCKRSLLRFNKNLKIIKLDRKELKDKKLYLRENDNDGSTEFTYTRFLVPFLNNYTGYAIFCDSDFLWRCDINIIKQYLDNTKSVLCVKHNYENCLTNIKMDGKKQEWYPRKNWSSLILFNNEHPSTKNLTLEAVNTMSPKWLHRFEWAKDEELLEIPKDYNYLVDYYENGPIKALHYTDGGPWHPGYENVSYGDIWLEYLSQDEQKKMKKLRESNYV